MLLNSHSRIDAPHEMHLRTIRLNYEKAYSERSVDMLGLDREELEHLLWDRILHWELERSGKEIIVDKTPGNAVIWKRLGTCWPDARYIFLLRHPASMVESLIAGRADRKLDQTVREVLGYVRAVDEARRALPGLTIRYEDLTADPAKVTRQVCKFLGVEWEAQMLDYGKLDHGPFRAGLGDWSKKIRSGKVQVGRPLPKPDQVPPELQEITKAWGYLD